MGKRALITGITGQDGAYLAKFLLNKGYEVFGLYRRVSSPNIWRLLALDIHNQITLIPGDMTDMASILNAIGMSKPDEIYNLAAQSFVGTSFEQPLATAEVDGTGVTRLLECVQKINPKIKVYHASTSELYGNSIEISKEKILNEESLFSPVSPYATSKLYSFHMIKIYRNAYGLFAVNGILFNHESPLRGLEFVTRKISNAVARIKLGLQNKIALGNLDAKRDWGYAPEYIKAMWLMLQQENPEDYVIATGETHSVREFLHQACKLVELDPESVTDHSATHERPLDIHCLRGDASKAKQVLGWKYQTSFEELVKIMVTADLERWQNHLEGKVFPWDAINDPATYQG